MRIPIGVLSLLFLAACGVSELELHDDYEPESSGDDIATLEQGLADCREIQSTGYRNGVGFPITLITVDGKLVEKRTGNAYVVMQDAAARNGVGIRINSGFRTPQEQQYLYNCYVNCNCNSCNLAARPGYSNHQSGTALDLNTANGAVFNWLNAHGGTYGFRRTVPSEPWHWEYFGGSPGTGPCEAPPPPPPCDRTAGPFTFSCDGAHAGQTCVALTEPSDPHTWNDNFVCTAGDYGFRWSNAGPLANMTCTNVAESAEANPAIWADNFFCAPPQSPWAFSWSSAGPIAGRTCLHLNETADPNSWHDNYLCATPVSSFTNAGFTFSMAGPRGEHCVSVNEPSDPDTWADNFFCSPGDLGMRWSHAGPIAGMRCTNVAESAEPLAAMWADNFLCLPESSLYRFRWSSAGPLAGLSCVRWFEHSETSPTWLDNWLCIEPQPVDAFGPDLHLPEFESTPLPTPPPHLEGSEAIGGEGATPGLPGTESEAGDLTAVQGGCSSVGPAFVPMLLALVFRRRRQGAFGSR